MEKIEISKSMNDLLKKILFYHKQMTQCASLFKEYLVAHNIPTDTPIQNFVENKIISKNNKCYQLTIDDILDKRG